MDASPGLAMILKGSFPKLWACPLGKSQKRPVSILFLTLWLVRFSLLLGTGGFININGRTPRKGIKKQLVWPGLPASSFSNRCPFSPSFLPPIVLCCSRASLSCLSIYWFYCHHQTALSSHLAALCLLLPPSSSCFLVSACSLVTQCFSAPTCIF